MSLRMERLQRKDKRSVLLKIGLLALLALTLLGVVYRLGSQAIITFYKMSRNIEVVKYATIEDILEGQAAVLNKEDLFVAKSQGRFENLVKDKEKVSKGTLLGYFVDTQGQTAVRSSQAGIFVRSTDGLEEVFDNINLEAVTPEVFQYKPTPVFVEKPIQSGQPIYKIIDNLVPTRLLITMPMKDIDYIVESNQRVKVLHNEQELDRGSIAEMKQEGNDLIMLVQLDNFNDSLLTQRYIKVEVVFDSQTGFLVPDEAIVEKEGKKGVYCSIGELTKFKPVKILKKRDGTVLVEGLDKNDFIVTNPPDKI